MTSLPLAARSTTAALVWQDRRGADALKLGASVLTSLTISTLRKCGQLSRGNRQNKLPSEDLAHPAPTLVDQNSTRDDPSRGGTVDEDHFRNGPCLPNGSLVLPTARFGRAKRQSPSLWRVQPII